jgi:hypothetical protein
MEREREEARESHCDYSFKIWIMKGKEGLVTQIKVGISLKRCTSLCTCFGEVLHDILDFGHGRGFDKMLCDRNDGT